MPNLTNAAITYLKESQAELKKVTWPTREETIRLTIVVVVASALLALFMGGVDYVFTFLLKRLLNLV